MKILKNNIVKYILIILMILVYSLLFLYDIIKTNKIYLIPLVFEMFIIILSIFKYKKNKKINLNIIFIIKESILLITLSLGFFNNHVMINEILIKSLITLTIIFQVLTFLKFNKD